MHTDTKLLFLAYPCHWVGLDFFTSAVGMPQQRRIGHNNVQEESNRSVRAFVYMCVHTYAHLFGLVFLLQLANFFPHIWHHVVMQLLKCALRTSRG